MTRKHFNAIAKALVRMQSDANMTKNAYEVVCRHMGDQLAVFNSRFDMDRWDDAVKWGADAS